MKKYFSLFLFIIVLLSLAPNVTHASSNWQDNYLKNFVKKSTDSIAIKHTGDKNLQSFGGLLSATITGPNKITITYMHELTYNNPSSYSNLGMDLLGRNITGMDSSGVDYIVLTFDGLPVPANAKGTIDIDNTVTWDGGNFLGTTAYELSDGQQPSLIMTTYSDQDESNTLTVGDTYSFRFSEPMDKSTITTGNVNTKLSLSNGHTFGTTGNGMGIEWNKAGTILTVTLGSDNTIAENDTTSAQSSVTDVAGNFNNTPAPLVLDVVAVTSRTLYFNAADDDNWSNLNNWWTTGDYNVQASSLPNAYDDVVVNESVQNASAYVFVKSLMLDGGNNSNFPGSYLINSVIVSTGEGAIFYTSSTNVGIIIGDLTVSDISANGYSISNDLKFASGFIIGDATFNAPTTANYGTIYGDTTFHGDFGNAGLIYGDVEYNDGTSNPGTVVGNVIFRDDSFNSYFGYGIIFGDVDVYFPAQNPLDGVVSGTITYHGYADAPVLSEVTPIPARVTASKAKYYFSVEGDTTSYEYLFTNCGIEVIVHPETHIVSFLGLKVGQTYGDCSFVMASDLGPDTNQLYLSPFKIISSDNGGSTPGVIEAFNTNQEILKVYNPIPKTNSTDKFIFTKILRSGMTDSDVLELQKFLNNHGYELSSVGAGSKGFETKYFGYATKLALSKFQKANNIAPAFGFFGPITMAVLNKSF